MERSKVEDLTPAEKKARVRISPKDSAKYPEWYYWPFERILLWASKMTGPTTRETNIDLEAGNWDCRYWGYNDWATPNHDNGIAHYMRLMTSQHIYNTFEEGAIPDNPDVQMNKLFAAPLERALKERTKTVEHQELQCKIFVMKYSLAPFMSSFVDDDIARYNEKQVRVWRLISCYGEINLDTLHDRILGPAMGWTRHYHSYKFVVPTSGACFRPKDSQAIDQMHAMNTYALDASEYQLCHLLREPGQKLAYIYDLGDQWVHNIELIQVANKGDALEIPADDQVKEALTKQYGAKLPELFGAQLFAGEINCPPEDSSGCDGMGKYGNILKKGPKYKSSDAARAQNWHEHKIRNAYSFDVAAHAQRLSNAISGKSSARSGQKVFKMTLGDPALSRNFFPDAKPGEKVTEGCLCNPITETIKTRPDKASEAVCATCGRQPIIEKGKRTPLLRCAGCKGAWYCGRDCQRSDWENHKGRCRKMKKERDAYKKEQAELKFTVD